MNLFIKGITIADPNSQFNHQTCDIRVENGKIVALSKKLASIKSDYRQIDGTIKHQKGKTYGKPTDEAMLSAAVVSPRKFKK